jgi:dTDP-D-glucose 4,6-dehydratase
LDTDGLQETVHCYQANREWWQPIKTGDCQRYYQQQYAARLS